jgi:O-antigen/teichoic acid export membrane protein
MFKNIISTIGAKAFSAVFSFLIIIVTAKMLGAEGRGTIGLFLATVTFLMMFNFLIGGSTLVYLIPRYSNSNLLWASYCWAFISNTLGLILMMLLPFPLKEYTFHIFGIALLASVFNVHIQFLIGKERVNDFNFISLLQVFLNLLVVCILFFLFKHISFNAFLLSVYISYSVGVLISYYAIRRILCKPDLKGIIETGKIALSFGFLSQLANLIQLINLRLNFFILEYFYGKESVGIFSTGSTLAESVWLIGGAMSVVQYSKISNTFNQSEAVKTSTQLGKTGLLVSLFSVIPFLILPEEFYASILGDDFKGIKNIILLLSPGIICIGFSLAFSHHFAGTGKYKINIIASFSGIIFTLIGSFLLIPYLGMTGAAISASISYCFITIVLMLFFAAESKVSLWKLFPGKDDIEYLVKILFQKIPKTQKEVK